MSQLVFRRVSALPVHSPVISWPAVRETDGVLLKGGREIATSTSTSPSRTIDSVKRGCNSVMALVCASWALGVVVVWGHTSCSLERWKSAY
jgi:hypothetical protein